MDTANKFVQLIELRTGKLVRATSGFDCLARCSPAQSSIGKTAEIANGGGGL